MLSFKNYFTSINLFQFSSTYQENLLDSFSHNLKSSPSIVEPIESNSTSIVLYENRYNMDCTSDEAYLKDIGNMIYGHIRASSGVSNNIPLFHHAPSTIIVDTFKEVEYFNAINSSHDTISIRSDFIGAIRDSDEPYWSNSLAKTHDVFLKQSLYFIRSQHVDVFNRLSALCKHIATGDADPSAYLNIINLFVIAAPITESITGIPQLSIELHLLCNSMDSFVSAIERKVYFSTLLPSLSWGGFGISKYLLLLGRIRFRHMFLGSILALGLVVTSFWDVYDIQSLTFQEPTAATTNSSASSTVISNANISSRLTTTEVRKIFTGGHA